jgi:uncharacterized protein YjbI with pentapeptide repeats
MANPEHLKILKQGVDAWNKWRVQNPKTVPDLLSADLMGAVLERADLGGVRFEATNLRRSRLGGANFTAANLAGADLSEAHLWTMTPREEVLLGKETLELYPIGASFVDANLSSTNLSECSLWCANFQHSRLRGANLRGADLYRANLRGAQLRGADLSKAKIGYTTFGDNDLSSTKGLETVSHAGPSTIGIDTIYKSKGNIPEVFLRGCGVPEDFIVYMRSLVSKAIDFYSCFISYSSKDDDFAQRLHADLQQKGVRCWFAPEDLKIGDKFRTRIDESIRIYDKVMVILSVDSIRSPWVEEEIEAALEKERKQNKLILFPIRLDDAVTETDQAWAASLRRARHIGDFRAWRDHDQYQKSFDRLLRDLKA